VRHDATLADIGLAFQALLYRGLVAIVLVRLTRRWRRTSPLERLQLMPVYASGLLTFLLVTVGQAGAGDVAWWAAFAAMAMLPFGFLAGLLRSHVKGLDADLRARLQELRSSRARPATPSAAAWSATSTTARRAGGSARSSATTTPPPG
jgi:hypothetical protein